MMLEYVTTTLKDEDKKLLRGLAKRNIKDFEEGYQDKYGKRGLLKKYMS